eukprot:SAG31_NODE_556_length_14161_cov_3.384943_9_plen_161_part_00
MRSATWHPWCLRFFKKYLRRYRTAVLNLNLVQWRTHGRCCTKIQVPVPVPVSSFPISRSTKFSTRRPSVGSAVLLKFSTRKFAGQLRVLLDSTKFSTLTSYRVSVFRYVFILNCIYSVAGQVQLELCTIHKNCFDPPPWKSKIGPRTVLRVPVLNLATSS